MKLQPRGLPALLILVALLAVTACRPRPPGRPVQAPGTFAPLSPVVQRAASALTSVSCSAPDDCLAVGRTVDGVRQVGMAQRWDGRRWTPAAAPPTPANHDLDLRTVACPRADHCVTVGATVVRGDAPIFGTHIYGKLYVARYDGRTWTDESATLPTGEPHYAALMDVDCTGDTCLAVGGPNNGFPDPDLPFVMTGSAFRSNGPGSLWTRMPGPPMGPSAVFGGLPGRYWLQIDCASPTSCASTSLRSVPTGTYTSYWDGTRWTYPSPGSPDDPVSRDDALVRGVACPAPRRCLATGSRTVGMDGTQEAAVLEWNGTAWTLVPVNGLESLGPVSCATPTRCLALDPNLANPQDLALSAVLDGRGWHAVTPPPTSGPPASVSGLTDVSCTPTMCLVVGYENEQPVAHRYAF